METAGKRAVSCASIVDQCRSFLESCPQEPLEAKSPIEFFTAVDAKPDAIDQYVAAASCAETLVALPVPSVEQGPGVADFRALVARLERQASSYSDEMVKSFVHVFESPTLEMLPDIDLLCKSQSLKAVWKLGRAFKAGQELEYCPVGRQSMK